METLRCHQPPVAHRGTCKQTHTHKFRHQNNAISHAFFTTPAAPSGGLISLLPLIVLQLWSTFFIVASAQCPFYTHLYESPNTSQERERALHTKHNLFRLFGRVCQTHSTHSISSEPLCFNCLYTVCVLQFYCQPHEADPQVYLYRKVFDPTNHLFVLN